VPHLRLWRLRRRLARRRCHGRGIDAPSRRAFARLDRTILIKRALTRGDLRNRLIDRRLPALFGGRNGGALKKLSVPALTFGTRRFVVWAAARRLCPTGMVDIPIHRAFVAWR
jgi:hypothetical protein